MKGIMIINLKMQTKLKIPRKIPKLMKGENWKSTLNVKENESGIKHLYSKKNL